MDDCLRSPKIKIGNKQEDKNAVRHFPTFYGSLCIKSLKNKAFKGIDLSATAELVVFFYKP